MLDNFIFLIRCIFLDKTKKARDAVGKKKNLQMVHDCEKKLGLQTKIVYRRLEGLSYFKYDCCMKGRRFFLQKKTSDFDGSGRFGFGSFVRSTFKIKKNFKNSFFMNNDYFLRILLNFSP